MSEVKTSTESDEPTTWEKVVKVLREFGHSAKASLHKVKQDFLYTFTAWIDPKLEPYREKRTKKPVAPTPKVDTIPKPYTPRTTEDFLAVLKRTPRSAISTRERHVIATIINFPNVRVNEIMLPQSAITYVSEGEVLGPLVLDRLYRSGYDHFPVLDQNRKIIGLIHTTALNSLEIKETRHAREILDTKVCYVREDYTLNQALAAFLRTNCYFFLVVDHFERIVGMLPYQTLMDYLLGGTPEDDFDRDTDRLAVAKRRLRG